MLTDQQKVALYQARVQRGQNDNKKWEGQAKARIARYRNTPNVEDFSVGGHRISVPTGTAIIDSMYSALTAVDVEVGVQPWAMGTPAQARVAERGIMEVWRETNVNRVGRQATKDALLVGIGWAKVGYDYAEHTELHPRDPDARREEIRAIYDAAVSAGEQPPAPEVAAGMVPDEEEVTVVDRDRIVVDYVPWSHMIHDPTAKRPEDIRWVAQITYLPVDEVKGNPGWRDYVKAHSGEGLKPLNNLVPDSKVTYPEDDNPVAVVPQHQVDALDDDARVAVVEYWDLTEGGTFCTFPLTGNFLLNEQPNPFGFNEDMEQRSPFVPLVLRTDPEHVRGISDMELIEPSLQELNRYRSVLINHLERHRGKLYGPERALTDSGKASLESKDETFVGLEEGFDQSAIGQMNPPPLPQELYQMAERVENHIREATGVSEVMRGLFPDRKRTATETAEVVAASSARQSEKRTLMEEFYTNIAKRILQLMQTYYTEERISRIVTEEGPVDWHWDAEAITMEADLEIVLAPKTARDSVWREERAMKTINLVAPLPEAKRVGLIKNVLRDWGYTIEEIGEMIMLPEEQEAKQKQEAEQAAAAAAMQAEAGAVGAASGDPNVPGGLNGPAPDGMTMQEAMSPERVYEEAAAALGPTGFMPGP